jgi:predicted lipoprotein
MIRNSIYILLLTVSIFACKKGEDTSVSNEFDKSAFLINAADNVIVPAYENALSTSKELQIAANTFTLDGSLSNLENLKEKWQLAFLAWQGASPFNFGPAENGSLRSILEDIATFPINASKTEAYILKGDAGLNNFDRDTRGFSGVDYLINNGTEQDVLSSFNLNRRDYLNAVVSDIVFRIENVTSLWKGDYRASFVTNTSTSAGGSISTYYNQFVISYEGNKRYKLAFPAGLGAGQSYPQPELLEAHYGQFSLELVKAHFIAIENIWYGKSLNGSKGTGFDDFLDAVEGGPELKTQTINSLANVWEKINEIPQGSLVQTLNLDASTVIATVEEMQKHTRYFKSDLSTKIGIAITFSDGDGD